MKTSLFMGVKSGMPRGYRRYAWTWNNYTASEETRIKDPHYLNECLYMIFGHEIGAQGTPHLQGYVEFATPKIHSQLVQFFGSSHFFALAAVGDRASNFVYCTKGNDRIFEYISPHLERSDRNTETRLNYDRRNTAENSFDWLPRAAENPYQFSRTDAKLFVKYANAIRFAHSITPHDYRSDIFVKKVVNFYWGNSGTGKTLTANSEISTLCQTLNVERYRVPKFSSKSSIFFEGYHGQKIVLFDQLNPQTIEFDLLMELLDGYEVIVQVKGSHAIWMPTHVYITCVMSPEDFFTWSAKHRGNQLEELMRRLTKITHFE